MPSDYDVHTEELALVDLHAKWHELNDQQYDSRLAEPRIALRRMARSQGFYKHKPKPSITINTRLAINNWPKTLDVLAYCVSQQAKARVGEAPDSPRMLRRMIARASQPVVVQPESPKPIPRKVSKAAKPIPHTVQAPKASASERPKPVDMVTLAIQIPRSELDALRKRAHESGDTAPVIVLKGKFEM
jgi:hypothetical protein